MQRTLETIRKQPDLKNGKRLEQTPHQGGRYTNEK